MLLVLSPVSFLAAINAESIPICTDSSGSPPIYGSSAFRNSASSAILALRHSFRYFVAACRNVLRGRTPYTSAFRISSNRRARYRSASARSLVPVLSQSRRPRTHLSTCQVSPRLTRPGVLFCLVDMAFLLSPVARCGTYIHPPRHQDQVYRSQFLVRLWVFR